MGVFTDSTRFAAPQGTYEVQQAQLPNYDFLSALQASQQQQGQAFGQAQTDAQQQQALAEMLRARAEGRAGPSLAEMQLRQATDANAAQAAGLIASQRGLNPGLAARLGAQAQAGANQQAAGQAAFLRAQEQQQAQAMLAQQLAQQRAQNIAQQQAAAGFYGASGGFANQQSGMSLENQLRTQQLNQQQHLANQQARLSTNQLNAQQEQADTASSTALAGGAIQGLATVAAAGAENAMKVAPAMAAAAHGGQILGRAKVAGDSAKNDTVPAMLSPGEIVLPRSIALSPNAPELAASFVAELRRQSRPPVDYGRVLEARRQAGGR